MTKVTREKRFRKRISDLPMAGALLTEFLYEPGARLTIRFIQPQPGAQQGEFQIQFRGACELVSDADVGQPLKIIKAQAEMVHAPKSEPTIRRQPSKPHKVRIHFEKGSLDFRSDGWSLLPLRAVIVSNWTTIDE